MLKKILFILFAVVLSHGIILADSGITRHHVIVDTDGAMDDFRSICMLLACDDVDVLAITCSDGSLDSKTCSEKVQSLLKTLHHEGIQTGISYALKVTPPKWREFCQQVQWGNDSIVKGTDTEAIELINKTITNNANKVTFIALGSLNSFAEWVSKHPESKEKIDQIVWYNDEKTENGYNYNIDRKSYEILIKCGIPISIVSNNRNDLRCNTEYLSILKRLPSIYSERILSAFEKTFGMDNMHENDVKIYDDLIPLYFSTPSLFDKRKISDSLSRILIKETVSNERIYQETEQLLSSKDLSFNRVFKAFPIDTTLYKKEYATFLNAVLKKYGFAEWKAIVLTNEVHGHTGIYSIIGAKMGIRACEYFNVGVNDFTVVTFAGSKPPLSCLNDGIQISTGATIGQGLITVSPSVLQIPTATFEFNKQIIRITLKDEIVKQMQTDIKLAVTKFGLTNPKYWEKVEELAQKYWSELDRHDIFNIEYVNN